jgi:hypothetical protein
MMISYIYQVNLLPAHFANQRTLDSFYRRSQYQDYGGREWCNILLALGDVDPRIVAIMHDLVQERRALAATQGSASQGSAAKAPQVPRQERPGPSLGVQHKESEAKKARNYAKGLDKRLQEQDGWWAAGRHDWCMPWPAWQRLQADRDRAWDRAEELSLASGFPFFDRHGVRRQDDPRDLVGLALRRWCAERGVVYS